MDKLINREMIDNKMKKKSIVVLDTDLGTDDAFAILLLKELNIKVDYLVASYGNTTIDGACTNAVIFKKYFNLDYEIVKGLPPSENVSNESSGFHGIDGIAGCRQDMLNKLNITKQDLNDYMSIKEFEKKLEKYSFITYITIGTLTNLSSLLENTIIKNKLGKIYVMGGGINEFNCSHSTEFNFSKDAISVKKILTRGLNITLFPLDVTNYQRVSVEDINSFESNGKYPEMIKMLRYNLKSNKECNGIPAAVLHDTLPVLYLTYPEEFNIIDMKIDVDKYGSTKLTSDGIQIHICVSVKENFTKEMIRRTF